LTFVRNIYRIRVPYSNKNVFLRDKNICQYCGKKDKKMTIDHVLPKSRGGTTCYSNVVTSCYSCNNKKRNRTPDEANLTLLKAPRQPSFIDFLYLRMKTEGLEDVLENLI